MRTSALKKQQLHHSEEGATVVEFSVALIFLFFFLLIFFQIAMIFLAHERVTYAAYVGARVHSVRGNVQRAVRMVKGKRVESRGSDYTKVKENVELNKAFRNLYKGHERDQYFTISQEFEIPQEETDTGDNRCRKGPSGGGSGTVFSFF